MKSVFINCLFFFFVGFSLLANAQSYPELIKLTKSATKQNYEESEEKISKTVKKHKNDPYVYLERYFFYYKFYKNELALQDINKAIELMPSKYLFYEYRIDVLFEMDKLEDAWKDISTIYAMDKTIPDSYVYRGQYFLNVTVYKHLFKISTKPFLFMKITMHNVGLCQDAIEVEEI